MIGPLLRRIWALPLPRLLRQVAGRVIKLPWLSRLLFPHFLVGVVGLIRDEHGDFLLVRHTYRETYPWGLPTGFLEHGEQPEDALKREVLEEASLHIDLGEVWKVYSELDRPLVNIVYRASFTGGQFEPSPEISASQFFSPNQLPAMIPDQRRLVEACSKEVGH